MDAILSIKHLIKLISFSHDRFLHPVVIVLVGKYTNLQDSYLSVKKSLEHSGLNCERKIDLKVCKIMFVFLNKCINNILIRKISYFFNLNSGLKLHI